MTTPSVSPSAPLPASRTATTNQRLSDAVFGSLWPERDVPGRPAAVLRALLVGLAAALVLPERDLGLGTWLVLLAGGAAAVAVVGASRRTPYLLLCLALCTALVSVVALRDAAWIAVLCVLAAAAVAACAVVDARSVIGLAASLAAVPLAGLRGLPWLGRSASGTGRRADWAPVVRTAVVSVLLVVVLGTLFVSADAVFASWVDVVVPDVTLDSIGPRLVVGGLVAGLVLAATYVSLNPPAVERLARTPRPVRRPFEWLVPVGLVLGVYVALVAAQATVMFGGHDYLRATTGLTYADYVHQGFGQLTVATALTLGVVTTAARRASRATSRDRLVLRIVLGALCLLTLVVVTSALFRMHVYEEAYGFTTLRLLVSVFEGWLGLVVLLVMISGVRLGGGWLPRAAILSGAAALLGLALLNPDGYVAERNVERYAETGKADWAYLASLSDDAVPALLGLPSAVQPCVLGPGSGTEGDWLEWNLGRARAGQPAPTGQDTSCPSAD